MATTKSRINISLPEEVKEALVKLAKRDQMPAATKAEHLLEIGLELEEDQAWDKIASKRDTQDARFLTHSQAFNL
jgi:predicted DNA-binding protein